MRAGRQAALPAAPPGRISRRRLLCGLLAAGGAGLGAGAGYAYGIEPVWPRVNHHRMPLSRLGSEFQGARLIQISDLHVGPSVPGDYLQKWVDWITAQQPDFVVITGDCIHYSRAAGLPALGRLLGRLRAKEAVLVALGNHEWGASQPRGGRADVAERAANAMRAEGVRVLRNQAASFRRGASELHIVGLDDYWGDNYNPALAFGTLPAMAPTVVLSHNPDTFIDLLERPFDWMLSGHTHGGQVNIPLLGPPLLPVRHRQFAAGHFRLAGRNLYVNRGLGWARRVRFNARPEVTVFTLGTEQAP